MKTVRELNEALAELSVNEVISLIVAHVVLRGQDATGVVIRLLALSAVIGKRIEDSHKRIALAEIARSTGDEIEARRTKVEIG
jgi:hypothetical protein